MVTKNKPEKRQKVPPCCGTRHRTQPGIWNAFGRGFSRSYVGCSPGELPHSMPSGNRWLLISTFRERMDHVRMCHVLHASVLATRH